MQRIIGQRHAAAALLLLTVLACRDDRLDRAAITGPPSVEAAMLGPSQVASMYAVEFVATAATGWDMNDAGDVVGRSYRDTGCGPFCLPPEDIAVWRNGTRLALPLVPGFASYYQYPYFMNNQGVIGGMVGIIGSTTHAAVWTPNGTGYVAQDLGTYPGTASAEVAGIDDQGRMVGWSSTGGAIPSIALPFMWTQGAGMVNLATLGYPNAKPASMSPGGKVSAYGVWYQLGNPASATLLPPVPRGFYSPGGGLINDNGDQAHFLTSTSSQNLIYPFRLSNGGTWQQISGAGTGHMTRAGLGGINAAQDISFTVLSTGMIAAGPSGVGQTLAGLISPAYPGVTTVAGGALNASGEILSQAMIGRSQRLVKLAPVTPCGANCLVASSLVMTGTFVQDPAFPGSCFQGGKMYNISTATVTVTSETGAPLANVQVNGRFLDDYWTDNQVSATTNGSGVATWTYKGLCGVGAIAFFVDKLSLGTRTLDRTRGVLSAWVIPSVGPPPNNQPPVAKFTRTCDQATRTCSFNGTSSTDDVGIASYAWTFGDGSTGTGPTPTHTFAAPGSYQVTLTVTDGGGLTNALTKTVAITGTTNQPPVASWTFSCQPAPAHTCAFDGTGSRDPDGTIASYVWTNRLGQTVSTLASFTKSWQKSVTVTWTLTVTDNGGKTGALTKTFTVP